ncbi:PEP-CTERM sorting domain-containing protein [Cerasicoccus fimbriatus]|uniref:PEP-CTERM sorting domain-containing protein n=1 Tax=Cerasicoccus fimbriatus TaxID=3014554 RepID=UPI0022B37BB4|nr:PEP-CTERM sorting domain-containing protein [Cerasicoccus sp. TK19100]
MPYTKLFSVSLVSVALLSASAQADVFLIDFNNVANSNGYPGGASAWNAYTAPSGVNGSLISDTTGSTGMGLTLNHSGTMTDSTNGNANTFNNATGGPSWVTTDGSLANTAAAADYFFTSTSADTDFTITFGNLTPGDTVDIDLWMSRNSTSNSEGFYEYSLDGGTSWFGLNVLEKDGTATSATYWVGNNTQTEVFRAVQDGNDAARYMNMGGLTVGGAGTLDVRVNDASSGGWAGLAAARLTVTPVPEPSTYAMLLGVAVLGITYVRRRR